MASDPNNYGNANTTGNNHGSSNGYSTYNGNAYNGNAYNGGTYNGYYQSPADDQTSNYSMAGSYTTLNRASDAGSRGQQTDQHPATNGGHDDTISTYARAGRQVNPSVVQSLHSDNTLTAFLSFEEPRPQYVHSQWQQTDDFVANQSNAHNDRQAWGDDPAKAKRDRKKGIRNTLRSVDDLGAGSKSSKHRHNHDSHHIKHKSNKKGER